MKPTDDMDQLMKGLQAKTEAFMLAASTANSDQGNNQEFDDIRNAADAREKAINVKANRQDMVNNVLCSTAHNPSLEDAGFSLLNTALYQQNEEQRQASLTQSNQQAKQETLGYFDGRQDFLREIMPKNFKLVFNHELNALLKETIGNQGIRDAIVETTLSNLSQITREIDGRVEINSEAIRKILSEMELTQAEIEIVKSSIEMVTNKTFIETRALERRMLAGERTATTTQGILRDHIKIVERWWRANEVERQQQQFRQNALDTFRMFSSLGELGHSSHYKTLSQIGMYGAATVQLFDGLSKLQNLPADFQRLNNLGNLANGLGNLSGMMNAAQGLFAVAGPIGSIVAAFVPIIGMLRKNKQPGPNPFSEILKHQSYMFSHIMNGLMMIDNRLIAMHQDIHEIQNMLCQIANRQISEFFDVKTLLILGFETMQNSIIKMHFDLKRRLEDNLLTPLQLVLFKVKAINIRAINKGKVLCDEREYDGFRTDLLFWVEKSTSPLLNGRALAEQENLKTEFPAHVVNISLKFCGVQNLDFIRANRYMGNLIGYLAEFAKGLFREDELPDNQVLLDLLNSNFPNPLIWLDIIEQYGPLISNIARNHPDWLGEERLSEVIKNGEDVVQFIKTVRTNEQLLPRLFENYDRALTEVYDCINVLVQEANKKLNESNTASKISILDDLAVKLNDFRDLRPLEPRAEYGQERLDVEVFYQKLVTRGFSIPSELLLLERLGGPKISLEFTNLHTRKGVVRCEIKLKYNNVILIGNAYSTGGYIPGIPIFTATLPWLWQNAQLSHSADLSAEKKVIEDVRVAALNEINEKIKDLRKELLNKLLEPGSAYNNAKFKPVLERLEAAHLMLRAFLILAGYKLDAHEMNQFWGQDKILNHLINIVSLAPSQLSEFMTQIRQLPENNRKVRKEMLEQISSGQGLEDPTLENILNLRLASLKQLERTIHPRAESSTTDRTNEPATGLGLTLTFSDSLSRLRRKSLEEPQSRKTEGKRTHL